MTPYKIIAANLNEIYGATFDAYDVHTNCNISFIIYDKSTARTRLGLEAYGLLVDCMHPNGRIPSFLKIFKQDIPARRSRTEALIRMGLATTHPWMFQGVPYAWLPGTVVNGRQIIGHVAQQIGARYGQVGEDFGRLKSNNAWGVTYTRDVRRELAGQICCAIAAMEKVSLVHGDLSSGNIMISTGPDGERICTLCDFDCYYNSYAEPLPRVYEGKPCRPLGSMGYQYPNLIERIDRDPNSLDATIFVESDRFALAALVCEIMVWSTDTNTVLGRGELLTMDDIRARRIGPVPASVFNTWPEGFSLLERTLKAGSIDDFPSPKDWLKVLGVRLDEDMMFAKYPYLEIYKRTGTKATLRAAAGITKSTSGSLSVLAPELGQFYYTLARGRCAIRFDGAGQMFLRRDGVAKPQGNGPLEVGIGPNDALIVSGWEIRAYDGADGKPS